MNRYYLILMLLCTTQTIPTNLNWLGIEITFPPSQLWWVCKGGESIKIYNTVKKAGWENNPYWRGLDPSLPQVDGYYAAEDSVDIVLQSGVNIQNGFKDIGTKPYASPIIYFSDAVRSGRNGGGGSGKFHGFSCGKNVNCPQGPSSCVARGASPNYVTNYHNFDYQLAMVLLGNGPHGNHSESFQVLKYFGLLNQKRLTIAIPSFPKTFNGEKTPFYFAETGVFYYLPIHMISPGDPLLAADPDYLNHGPAPFVNACGSQKPCNTPYSDPPGKDGLQKGNGHILPWTHMYMPKDLPQEIAQTKDF